MNYTEYRDYLRSMPIISGVNFRNIFLTFPCIETSRLILTQTELEDCVIIEEFLKEGDIAKFYVQSSGENYNQPGAVAQAFFHAAHDSFFKIGRITWAIREKDTKFLIGIIESYTDDLMTMPVEIQGFISEKYTGNGYATEVLKSVKDFFFINGVKELLIKERLDNEKAKKVLEKLNFDLDQFLQSNVAQFILSNDAIDDEYFGWADEVFLGKNFTQHFYNEIEGETATMYVFFPIDDDKIIAAPCDPLTPQAFKETNAFEKFCIDRSKIYKVLNNTNVLIAKKC